MTPLEFDSPFENLISPGHCFFHSFSSLGVQCDSWMKMILLNVVSLCITVDSLGSLPSPLALNDITSKVGSPILCMK